jgi:hypothetical protein
MRMDGHHVAKLKNAFFFCGVLDICNCTGVFIRSSLIERAQEGGSTFREEFTEARSVNGPKSKKIRKIEIQKKIR